MKTGFGRGRQSSELALYKVVQQTIRKKIINREWLPGDCLPSEHILGEQLDASQGTVRKALTELEAENIIVRRQGKGTYVARHSNERSLFRFFRMYGDSGRHEEPRSQLLSCTRRRSQKTHAGLLDLAAGEPVFIILRLRGFGKAPTIVEQIVVSAKRFVGIDSLLADLPNTLYQLYEETFGVTVARADEQIKAVAAKKREAKLLHTEPGTPLLRIERLAYDLRDNPVELRISHCLTDDHHYASNLE